MTCEQQYVGSEPPKFQPATFADEPVYLLFSLNGIDIDPIVEHLEREQASFVSTKYFDMFYEGQMIGPAVLSLQDEGMAIVYPVVKSRHCPVIGVEFMEISENDRQMITRFLANRNGGLRPPANRRTLATIVP